MSEPTNHEHDELKIYDASHLPAADYHDRTVNVKAIALAGLAILGAALIFIAILAFSLEWLTGGEASPSRVGTSIDRPPDVQGERPQAPALEVDEPSELRALRAQEDRLLNSYGWVDEGNDVVRIPVDRAMQIIVERGLEARPAEEMEAGREVEAPDWHSGQPLNQPDGAGPSSTESGDE